MYGLKQLRKRQAKIRGRSDERWDDPYGPVVLTAGLIFGLLIQFIITVSVLVNCCNFSEYCCDMFYCVNQAKNAAR
jgi:hypothetical protein